MKPAQVAVAVGVALAWLAVVGVVSEAAASQGDVQLKAAEPSEEPDVYRPQPGTLLKTKLCMRCKHVLTAAKMNKKNMKEQSRAMEVSKALGKRAKALGAAREAARAAAAGALDQPFFGSDPFDPAQVKKDAKLEKCLRLPSDARPACVAAANGAMMSIPDPSWVKGLDPKVPTAPMLPPMNVPTLETDPHRVTGDPSRPFTPYNPTDSLNTQGGQSPFTGASLLELEVELELAERKIGSPGQARDSQLSGAAVSGRSRGPAAAARGQNAARPMVQTASHLSAVLAAPAADHRFLAGGAAIDADADADADAEGEDAVAADLGLDAASGFGEAVDLEGAAGAFAGSLDYQEPGPGEVAGGGPATPTLGSGGDAAGADGVDIASDLAAGAPPPPAEAKDPNADAIPGPQPGADDSVIVMVDLPVCINEGSRRFIYSLFRGLVGPDGDVECIDIKEK